MMGLYGVMSYNVTRRRGEIATPVAARRFLAATTELTILFEDGTPIRMRMIAPVGEILYGRVEPAEPAAAELAALAGEYESRETGTTLKLAPGVRPGEMAYRISSNTPVTLRPLPRRLRNTLRFFHLFPP